MAIAEENILKPKNSAIQDFNDWPTYTLRRVKCFSEDGALVSLLSAHTDNALRIVGALDTVNSELSDNGTLDPELIP